MGALPQPIGSELTNGDPRVRGIEVGAGGLAGLDGY